MKTRQGMKGEGGGRGGGEERGREREKEGGREGRVRPGTSNFSSLSQSLYLSHFPIVCNVKHCTYVLFIS